MTAVRPSMTRTPEGGLRILSRLSTLLLLLIAIACSPAADQSGSGSAQGAASGPVEVSGAAVDEILAMDEPLARIQRIAALLEAAEQSDLGEILDAFERAPLAQGAPEYGLFGGWWASFDPHAAFAYADSMLRADHPAVVLSVVRSWTRTDPLGAAEAKELISVDSQVPAIRRALAQVFVDGWFASGEDGLENWIVSQRDPRAVRTALEHYARNRVIRDGAKETLEWTRSAEFPQADRNALLVGALSVVVHQDPELAVEWVPVAEGLGIDVRAMLVPIGKNWAAHKPADAMAWVIGFPESVARDEAIRQVARRWMRRDPLEMERWLGNVEGAPVWLDTYRNLAIRAHVNQNHFHVDWPEVIDLVDGLDDGDLKARLLLWTLKRWNVAEPEAADAWMAANTDRLAPSAIEQARKLPAAERERIEEALRHKRAADAAQG